MFRLTCHEGEDEIGITLEGRVAGTAVAELNRAWQELAPRRNAKHLWIDLRRVTHSDAAGKQMLGTIYAETRAQLLTRTLWSEYLALEIKYGAADSVFAHACE
jgi:anti-anti-sigma regulatory factor